MEAKPDIIQLIPQRPPFVMVDTLLSADTEQATSSFLVRKDNIFVQDGHLQAGGLLENMAQTCAAQAGNLCHGTQEVKRGFIGAVIGMTVHRLPQIGETLYTAVHITASVGNINKAEAEIRIEQRSIATAGLTIVTEA